MRSRGDAAPPPRTAMTQVAITTGSTSRSKPRSIGICTLRWMSSNGTSHTTARNIANIHGASRPVCGHASVSA